MTQKETFLRKFNEAFATSDIEYILAQVTDDIRWAAIDEFIVEGKEQFSEILRNMKSEKPYEVSTNHIITHGDSAAVDGIMTLPDGKTYAFCDVYKFRGFKKPKIKEITSYVIEIKESKRDEFVR